MAKNLSLLCIILSLGFGLRAQEFVLNSENPFNIQIVSQDSQRVALKYLFDDRDRDGDLDLFLIGFNWDASGHNTVYNMLYYIDYQENIGTPQEALFGPRETAFAHFTFPNGTFSPSIGDINGDGYLDLVAAGQIDTLSEQLRLVIYRNTGTPDDVFDYILADSFDLPPLWPRSLYTPEITDMDLDGDPDILISGYIPVDLRFETYTDIVLYAKNTGTAESPEFLGWFDSPYGLGQDSVYEVLKTGDIDNDGDLDILSITAGFDTLTPLAFYRNIPGSNGKPSFEPKILSPFGLPDATPEKLFIDLNLVDIDNDQDLDVFLLVLDIEGNLVMDYYENVACAIQTTPVEAQICDGESLIIGGMEFYDAGMYVITLTDANGCDSIIELTLDVMPVFEVFLSETLCDGDVFMIGNEVFTTSGDYTVALTSVDGCDSLVFAMLEFESVDTSVTQDGQLLTANLTGVLYQWLDCDSGLDIAGATNRAFTPEVSGNYAVRITNLLGCTGTSDCYTVIVSGVIDLASQDAIRAYPNPATDYVWIGNFTGQDIRSIALYNESGKLVTTRSGSMAHGISLHGLQTGVYLLRIDLDNKSVLRKLVVIAF